MLPECPVEFEIDVAILKMTSAFDPNNPITKQNSGTVLGCARASRRAWQSSQRTGTSHQRILIKKLIMGAATNFLLKVRSIGSITR